MRARTLSRFAWSIGCVLAVGCGDAGADDAAEAGIDASEAESGDSTTISDADATNDVSRDSIIDVASEGPSDVPPDALTDASLDSKPDASAEASIDGGATDVADVGDVSDASTDTAPAAPTRLLTGIYALYGVTKDDWVLAWDRFDASIHAVPLDGGAAQVLATPAHYAPLWISGHVVFFYDDDTTTLSTWTPAGGVHVLSTRASTSAPDSAAATSAGDSVVWMDTASPTTVDLRWAKVDGTAAKTISAGATGLSPCTHQAFGAPGRILVTLCDMVGTTRDVSVASVDGTSGAMTPLAVHTVSGWSFDPTGAWIFARDLTTSTGQLVPTDGSAPTTLAADSPGVSQFLPDSSAVLYGGYPGGAASLRRVSVTGGAVSTISSPAGSPLAISPDSAMAVFGLVSPTTGPGTDLRIVSTMGGTARVLTSTTTCQLVGPGFTKDSRFVVYTPDASYTSFSGELDVIPASGGARISLASTSTFAYALSGSKLLYDSASSFYFIDLSTTAPRRSVASLAKEIRPTATGDRFVYTTSTGTPSTSGIWVIPAP